MLNLTVGLNDLEYILDRKVLCKKGLNMNLNRNRSSIQKLFKSMRQNIKDQKGLKLIKANRYLIYHGLRTSP